MKDSKAQNLLGLPEEILFALCVIGGVLITASLIVFILTKLNQMWKVVDNQVQKASSFGNF